MLILFHDWIKGVAIKNLKLLSEFYSNVFPAAMGQFHVTEWTTWENDSTTTVCTYNLI